MTAQSAKAAVYPRRDDHFVLRHQQLPQKEKSPDKSRTFRYGRRVNRGLATFMLAPEFERDGSYGLSSDRTRTVILSGKLAFVSTMPVTRITSDGFRA